jgi:hypothetical protein
MLRDRDITQGIQLSVPKGTPAAAASLFVTRTRGLNMSGGSLSAPPGDLGLNVA